MNRSEFRKMIDNRIVVFDGATGSNLQKAGMPTGVCPEKWILEHREVMIDLQRKYVEAGSDIVYAPTFTCNRIKLAEYGLEDQIESMNRELVALSKEAVGENALVAGNLTMTGEQLYPMGTLQFEELVDIYKEQVRYLEEAGVDLYVVETMMSLQECRAAVLAIRETSDLPVVVSLTYNEDGRTLYGTDPKTAVVVLQSLGADVVGINCSTGPKEMISLVKEMMEVTNVPILVKPNAGLPKLVDGETVYDMTPEVFAEEVEMLVKEGAGLVGGCCGTTPEHISCLVQKVKSKKPIQIEKKNNSVIASERSTLTMTLDGRFLVIGERINPTGKKKLQAALREGRLDMVLDMAEQQEEAGADILDINMGMNGIDEKAMMIEVVQQVAQTVNLPLCIDSSHIDVMEEAIRVYPGRALINSISLEKEKFEKLLPIAKKYGAMFILLPLSDEGLPKSIEEKKKIIHTIVDRALEIGLSKEDIVVDGLVATVGADSKAAIETMETIRYCKEEMGLLTSCGLSNISFGLPERIHINSAFLTMAIQNGLTMAIANPNQEQLMSAAAAADLLLNKPGADLIYINRVSGYAKKKKEEPDQNTGSSKESDQPHLFELVLKGKKDIIVEETKKEVENGAKPEDIINEMLIPAINKVGELFNEKKYFLPQLIASAETMKMSIEYLEPLLESKGNGEVMPTIVIATVEGDIHDIGKNLVALMLKNYGYRVIDLGKDVPKEVILDTAEKEHAQIVALSALMTTTMMRMKDVVELRNERKMNCKIMIGGAVITQSFADEIGAEGYSEDAADAVNEVKRLLG